MRQVGGTPAEIAEWKEKCGKKLLSLDGYTVDRECNVISLFDGIGAALGKHCLVFTSMRSLTACYMLTFRYSVQQASRNETGKVLQCGDRPACQAAS